MKRRALLLLGIEVLIGMAIVAGLVPPVRARLYRLIRPKADVETRVRDYGPAARARLRPSFARAGVQYPPAGLTLLALKAERRMEVYAMDAPGAWRWIADYPILAASGGPGPKLQRGDGQVPEGVYGVESLNPNSLYHLALRVAYPNAFDRARAAEDGRGDLGGDIMIHGGAGSVGCLAMGDPAAEDLFVLSADVGIERVRVVILPRDMRGGPRPARIVGQPPWVADLYAELADMAKELARTGP